MRIAFVSFCGQVPRSGSEARERLTVFLLGVVSNLVKLHVGDYKEMATAMTPGHLLRSVIMGSAVFLFSAILSPEALCGDEKLDGGKYQKAVKKFSDSVIKNGRDTYGDRHTPLFVDGLQVETLEPVRWKFNPSLAREWVWAKQREGWDQEKIRAEQARIGVQTWVLSNFASQQSLLRTLDALTALTGEKKYRQAAHDATDYALKNLRGSNGLLYWGGHLAWDLQLERKVGPYADVHELKAHQPYFQFMWEVNPEATRSLMEAIWAAHIRDWNTLNYKRHTGTGGSAKPQWDHEFDADIEVPFVGKGLSFTTATPPIMHSGVMLSVLGKDEDAMKWTRRLIYRWQQAKHPTTGLCGGQLNYWAEGDRAQAALKHVHPSINEAKIVTSYHESSRYHRLPLSQMQAGETLIRAGGKYADVGREFIAWAMEDLKIYTRNCYDADSGRFIGRMIDGTPIKGQESKSGYYTPEHFRPRAPSWSLLWGYAMAYRISKDEAYWNMFRQCATSMGIGDIGLPDGKEQALTLDTDLTNCHAIHALLELYRAQGDRSMLRLACRIADNLVESQAETGLFPRPGRMYARTGSEVPLALLHLAAALEGRSDEMPQPPICDNRYFHCTFHGELPGSIKEKQAERMKSYPDSRTYDSQVFY